MYLQDALSTESCSQLCIIQRQFTLIIGVHGVTHISRMIHPSRLEVLLKMLICSGTKMAWD